MNLKRKLNFAVIPLLLCLILLLAASYAWMIMSLSPEITNIDTNVGANGSLEIALLSEKTYADPLLIRTVIGDSAVAQDAMESNLSWGNVIELADERYGMTQLSLHPARLNLSATESGNRILGDNLLKVAEFGVDGRINVLSADTVSALYEENAFRYYVENQRYGIRAIGTISNLTPQQTVLASARTMAQSYTAAASRTVKNTWRDNGPALMNLFSARYESGKKEFTPEDVALIRDTASRTATALEYAELTLRQGILGIAASRIADTEEFEKLAAVIHDVNVPLSDTLNSMETQLSGDIRNWANQLTGLKKETADVIAACDTITGTPTWVKLKPLLDVLVNADRAYLGDDHFLGTKEAFTNKTADNILTAMPDSGILAKMAQFAGNYSTFFRWTETVNVEVRTADPVKTPYLVQVVDTLKKSSQAALGGWTRADLDKTYGLAMDLAFRCNLDSDLLLQTSGSLRVDENAEFPVTQGGGSYMRFTSEVMDTQQLIQLMDTIRIGFLDDKNQLVALAKLNVSNYQEQEAGVFAPLYLYECSLEDTGALLVGERRKEGDAITHLSQNSPTILTVVVWLDGDQIENSYVSALTEQSMSGILNLQFASSADLRSTQLPLTGKD
ncbi:MAG: hypothetical protein IJN20_01120 [Oscillospiraceae bacterium]|nr:hypothetical protein [Oscillospiraceae bacterium]